MQREKHRKSYNEPKKNRVLPIIAFTLIFLLGLIGGLSARYIFNSEYSDNQAKADGFYFTIDLLGDTNETEELTKTIHLYGGKKQKVTFKVQNYFDALRISQDKIIYSVAKNVTTEDGEETEYTKNYLGKIGLKKDGQVYTSDETLEVKSEGTAHSYELTMPEEYQDNTTVTITVISSEPYKKEMKLNFVLHPYEADVTWRIEDKEESVTASLIIMSDIELEEKQLKIDWSAINQSANVLQIDTTDEDVLDELDLTTNDPNSSWLSVAMNTKEIEKSGSIKIVFFKSNPNVNYATVADQAAEFDSTNNIYLVKITK